MKRYLGDDFLLPTLNPQNTPYFTSGSVQIQTVSRLMNNG